MVQDARILSLPPISILENASLFLDFDGTLVEIAARPDAVDVGQRVRVLLSRLQQKLHGRLAIVSGRSIADIVSLFGSPGFIVAGSHGAELLYPGESFRRTAPMSPDKEALALLQDLRMRHPDVLIELKPSGLALHYRMAPEAADDCLRTARELAARAGLELQPGKMVIELKAAGHDKGTVLQTLMVQPQLRPGRPVFIGDDQTDEAGFCAAAALGGAGILVGEMRPTAAAFRLEDVEGALTWLESAVSPPS